ncbi:MAG: type II secretion system F family protein [Candidatus Nanopelagicales bacterium]
MTAADLGTLMYWLGFGALALAVVSVLVAIFSADDERPAIRRNLDLLDREIREWARLKRKQEIPHPLHIRMLHAANPVGRRLVLPNSLKDLESKVTYAGNPPFWTLDNILAMKVFSVVAGLTLGIPGLLQGSSTGLLAGLGITLIGYEIPDLMIGNLATQRQADIRRSLADTLDLLTVTVEAGLGFDAAVSQVATHSEGPLAGELRRYLKEKQIGLSSREALQSLAARTTVAEMKSFTSALLQAERIGISIGPVLRELTSEMRIKRRQRAQEKAQQVPIKILVPMLLFIFPTFLIVVLGPAALNAIKQFSGH